MHLHALQSKLMAYQPVTYRDCLPELDTCHARHQQRLGKYLATRVAHRLQNSTVALGMTENEPVLHFLIKPSCGRSTKLLALP